MRAIVVLVSAAVLAAAVGCQGEEGPEAGTARAPTTVDETSSSPADSTTTPPSTRASEDEARGIPTIDELRWAGSVVRWSSRLGEALIALGRADVVRAPRVDRALSQLRNCGAALGQVDEPPNDRLLDVQRNAEEICELLERAAPLLREALADPDSDAAARIEDDAYRVAPLFTEIRADLEPFMPGEGRSLPEAGGAYDRTTSRVDVRLGEVASLVADSEVEVRCWSPRDWRAVSGRPRSSPASASARGSPASSSTSAASTSTRPSATIS